MGEIEFEVNVVRDASGTLVATYGQNATAVRGSAPFMLYRAGEAVMLPAIENAAVGAPLVGT
jgi:hypothetical protein